MTPTELADALERVARYRTAPGPERDVCIYAARRLRELDAVRAHAFVAMEEAVRAGDVSVAQRDLCAALARVGGDR